jgi:heptosyltransferase II
MACESILMVSSNWIGDAVMSMPAVQLFRRENPDAQITMLAKPGPAALWQMHPAIDHCQTLTQTGAAIRQLRQMHFDRAFLFPNSFRSAFLPFTAGIPHRIGARGHWRRWMLTDIIRLGSGHQQFENMNILGVQGEPPAPQIIVPDESRRTLEDKLTLSAGSGKPLITLLPGAARGPSKRWPPEQFIALTKKLLADDDVSIVLSGGAEDAAACTEMASAMGPETINLAGNTTIPEWAALLQQSRCVVANDSGGMHLATAVGTPVAAIFGITDPKKTGPLGESRVLQQSVVQSRNVARRSKEAVRALAAVTPEQVFDAIKKLLRKGDNNVE